MSLQKAYGKDFSEMQYGGNLKNHTYNYFHKGFIDLNGNEDVMQYFIPFDLDEYMQISTNDARLYDIENIEYLHLYKEYENKIQAVERKNTSLLDEVMYD